MFTLSIIKCLLETFSSRWDSVALQTIEHQWTYKKLIEESCRISSYIKKFQLKVNSHVAVYSNNEPFFIFAQLGALLCGYRLVPIPYSASKTEISTIISCCDVKLVLSKYDKPKDLPDDLCWVTSSEMAMYFSELTDENQVQLELNNIPEINQDEPVLLLPTSGTTGKSKTVMLSHINVLSNARAHGKRIQYSENDIFLITMPMHFSSTITTQIISCLLYGTKIFIVGLPLLSRVIFNCIKKQRITGFSAVPTIFQQLISDFEQNSSIEPLESVEFIVISGAPVSPLLFQRIKSVFPNADVIQTYGLTEASPRVSMMERTETRLSCGTPVEGVSIQIVDENGQDIGRNQIGEILVKGLNVMIGYYGDLSLTEETIINGWLKTGDLGYINEYGCLFVTGRRKNIIISGGINIYPEEVEDYLSQFKEVEEVIVIGENDELLGEIPIVFVKLLSGCHLNIEEIKKKCLKDMSSYKVPKKWIVLDQIPKTKTGKLDRAQLKVMLNEIHSVEENRDVRVT